MEPGNCHILYKALQEISQHGRVWEAMSHWGLHPEWDAGSSNIWEPLSSKSVCLLPGWIRTRGCYLTFPPAFLSPNMVISGPTCFFLWTNSRSLLSAKEPSLRCLWEQEAQFWWTDSVFTRLHDVIGLDHTRSSLPPSLTWNYSSWAR